MVSIIHGRFDKFTYSLGFFFGPGLPLGFVAPSDGIGVDLFTPFIAGVFFLLAAPGVDTSCVGMGVEFASDVCSCDATVFN